MLRCETASEKYAWLARLKYVSESSGIERPVRKYTSAQLAEHKAAAEEGRKKHDKAEKQGVKVRNSLSQRPSRSHPCHLAKIPTPCLYSLAKEFSAKPGSEVSCCTCNEMLSTKSICSRVGPTFWRVRMNYCASTPRSVQMPNLAAPGMLPQKSFLPI